MSWEVGPVDYTLRCLKKRLIPAPRVGQLWDSGLKRHESKFQNIFLLT